jgi:hypothetical protein
MHQQISKPGDVTGHPLALLILNGFMEICF